MFVQIMRQMRMCLPIAAIVLSIASCQPPRTSDGKTPAMVHSKAYLYVVFLRRDEIKTGEDLEVSVQWAGTDNSWAFDKCDIQRKGNQVTITPMITRAPDGGTVAIVTPRRETCRVSKLPPGQYTVVVDGIDAKKTFKVKVK